MSMLSYWHPVMRSRDLATSQVRGIKLAYRSIALFRGADGQLGAVEDKCAHRRMKLSVGKVEHGELVCPYHAWKFNAEGQGESPNAPKLHACIPSYDCAEYAGVIWVKSRGGKQELPLLEMDGSSYAGVVFNNRIQAPLELVMDNFSELEHTVTTHPHFGFDPPHASEAVMELETDDTSFTVHAKGRAKMPPLDTRIVVGVRPGDRFHSNFSFHFDPPRSVVTHLWINPQTERERMVKYHVIHYFVPETESETNIVTFCFLQIRRPVLRPFRPLTNWLFRRRTSDTVEEDRILLENLADKSTGMEDMKLSRFDTLLRLTRERLASIYYGTDTVSKD